jgi:hypothetical protein
MSRSPTAPVASETDRTFPEWDPYPHIRWNRADPLDGNHACGGPPSPPGVCTFRPWPSPS